VSDVCRHLHDGRDFTCLIADRGCVDNDGKLNSVVRPDLFFTFVTLPVTEGARDRAYLTSVGTAFVNLIAKAAFKITEVSPEMLVGVNYPKIPVLYRQITRHLLEVLSKRQAHVFEAPAGAR
jgi:hypothetical protein